MGTVTIKDIARECGVGVSTVSRAMNNHPDINPATKEKIKEVMDKYNYIPNNSARNLKRTDAQAIAVLVKGIGNPFFSSMITTIEREAEKKRYSCILQRVDGAEDEVDVAIELIKEKRLRGIIFLGGCFSHPQEQLERLQVPFVLSTVGIVGDSDTNSYSSVSVDDTQESYKVVDYLCQLGHKKIAIITACEEDESIGQLRLDGYKKALVDHHIALNEGLIHRMGKLNDEYSMESGYRLAKQLIDSKEEFTALYCISDALAVGAMRALYEAGIRIPEDVSVAGFDGINLGQFYTPSLTTLRQPVEEMALETIHILFGAIKKKPHIQKIFTGELVERESTRAFTDETKTF